jgi:hypothetical protein
MLSDSSALRALPEAKHLHAREGEDGEGVGADGDDHEMIS